MLQKHVSWNLGELYIESIDPTKIDSGGEKLFFNTITDDYLLPDVFYFHTSQPNHYPYLTRFSQSEVFSLVFHEPGYDFRAYESDFEEIETR